MPTNSVVCILGMQRSGTSAVTRLVNFLGVHLGPEEHLLAPDTNNPKGYWEHQPLRAINHLILPRLGFDRFEWPPFSPDWDRSREFTDLKERALTAIRQDFAHVEIWGWKDPWTCLTLPFWQQVVPRMCYVICLRNPIDVAKSLARRDGTSLAEGVHLWLEHVGGALQHTSDQSRMLVFYDDILATPARELERLASFIGGVGPEQLAEALRRADDFLDKRLQHHSAQLLPVFNQAEQDPVDQAAGLAQCAYSMLRSDGLARTSDVMTRIGRARAILVPEIIKLRQERHRAWRDRVETAIQEIAAVVPEGRHFILADSDEWGVSDRVAGRRCIPFLERDGQYFGPPPDDATAIRELDRLRRAGASFIAFGWPAFWWLGYYTGFHQYLRDNYHCVVESEHLIVFEL